MGAQMIVVHGWWSLPTTPVGEGALVLWAEDALGPVEAVRRPGRRPKVREHPFALPGDQLAKALGLDLVEDSDGVDQIGSAELILPSFTHAPAASPELLDLRST